MDEYILEMKGISKSFFGVTVLEDVNLQVKPGEVHVLLGENGAGKSTLIKILSCAYKREKGQIFLNGKELNATSPKEALDEGISVIYQEFNLNPHVSIYENIFLGREHKRPNSISLNKASMIEEAQKYMNMIGLTISPRTLVKNLSTAQKQMVEITKAISANVKVIVLDEPTAAITDKETEMLFDIIRNLKKQGIGIIYISHRMEELFKIGDRCTVMRDGIVTATLELCDSNVDDLTELMVGRKIKCERMSNPYVDNSDVVLSVKNLEYCDLLKNVSFELHKGEILGFAGLVGSGRTEIAKCILGAYKYQNGEILHQKNGTLCPLKKHNVSASINSGIVYLSEDRKEEGLIQMHSLLDNITLPFLKKFGAHKLNKKAMNDCVDELIQKMRIKTTSRMQIVQNLSGGNQQKAVIAKWLATDADVYIFDEPTRGIDVGARDEIYTIMLDIVSQGASIIMISSDLVEVMKMCDRIAVMREGRLVTVLDNSDTLTQKDVLSYAFAEVE